MASNREWLKSLSDEQLAEEIKYGRVLAESGGHREHSQRQLDEARLEKLAREQDGKR
jgi:hypothetical protein